MFSFIRIQMSNLNIFFSDHFRSFSSRKFWNYPFTSVSFNILKMVSFHEKHKCYLYATLMTFCKFRAHKQIQSFSKKCITLNEVHKNILRIRKLANCALLCNSVPNIFLLGVFPSRCFHTCGCYKNVS